MNEIRRITEVTRYRGLSLQVGDMVGILGEDIYIFYVHNEKLKCITKKGLEKIDDIYDYSEDVTVC